MLNPKHFHVLLSFIFFSPFAFTQTQVKNVMRVGRDESKAFSRLGVQREDVLRPFVYVLERMSASRNGKLDLLQLSFS